jgi:hypothetical protein
MRFRRALDRGNVTEALSAASELEHVGLAEALELCLLLRDKAPERYPPAALRWHGRFCREAQWGANGLSGYELHWSYADPPAAAVDKRTTRKT